MGEEAKSTVERKNYTHEEILEIIKEFPIQLFGNRVLVTVNTEQGDKLNLSNNTLAEEQYVVAVGPMAERFVKEGEKVILDLAKLMKSQQVSHNQLEVNNELDINPFVVGDDTFALINDNQIKAKYKNA